MWQTGQRLHKAEEEGTLEWLNALLTLLLTRPNKLRSICQAHSVMSQQSQTLTSGCSERKRAFIARRGGAM